MPSSNRARGRSERPATVKFAQVTETERRQPSWLARPSMERRYPSFHPTSPRAPLDVPFVTTRSESERSRPSIEPLSASVRVPAPTPTSSLPPNRLGVTPAELEAMVAERATQNAASQVLEEGRAAICEALETFDQSRRDLAYSSESRLVELAMLVARRVIGRELVTQPELVADLIREGVDALAASDIVRVRIGPAFAGVEQSVREHLASLGLELELTVSPSLPDYGCVVQTELGRVDESIEERLSVLVESIEEERHA